VGFEAPIGGVGGLPDAVQIRVPADALGPLVGLGIE
jgi:hypothetical protein